MAATLIVKLALRNLFRNTRRTLLTATLIACGLAALMFTDAMVRGMTQSMVNIATGTLLGEAQVHKLGFRRNNDVDLFIEHSEPLLQQLRDHPGVAVAAPRVLSGAMLASSENVAAAMVYGVEGQAEASLGKLQRALVQGRYFKNQGAVANSSQLLIGIRLAQLLEVELGDRVVVTVSQIHGGDLSQELFRVSGIFRFNDRMLDQNLAFVTLPRGRQLLGMSTGVHEIALRLKPQQELQQQGQQSFQWQRYNQPLRGEQLETLPWDKLIPQLSGVLEMSNYSTLIIAGILFVLVSLGLINSMFMSIYERQYEFGVLLALGTRRSQLFWQILCEGFLIGLLSALLGVLMGGLLSWWKATTGIDYSNLEMSGITLQEPIYLILHWSQFTWFPLVIVLMTVVACLYPALHAARLQPTEAMRKTL